MKNLINSLKKTTEFFFSEKSELHDDFAFNWIWFIIFIFHSHSILFQIQLTWYSHKKRIFFLISISNIKSSSSEHRTISSLLFIFLSFFSCFFNQKRDEKKVGKIVMALLWDCRVPFSMRTPLSKPHKPRPHSECSTPPQTCTPPSGTGQSAGQ